MHKYHQQQISNKIMERGTQKYPGVFSSITEILTRVNTPIFVGVSQKWKPQKKCKKRGGLDL